MHKSHSRSCLIQSSNFFTNFLVLHFILCLFLRGDHNIFCGFSQLNLLPGARPSQGEPVQSGLPPWPRLGRHALGRRQASGIVTNRKKFRVPKKNGLFCTLQKSVLLSAKINFGIRLYHILMHFLISEWVRFL